jgi:hypothetical protein
LQNAIESPVRIRSLPAQLRRGQTAAPAVIQNFTPPVDIPPQGDVVLTVTSPTPLQGSEPLYAAFDLGDVEVLPDREAVWNAIINPSTSEYFRTIHVKTSSFAEN